MTATHEGLGLRPLPPHDETPTIMLRSLQHTPTELEPVREASMPAVSDRTGIGGLTSAFALLGLAALVVALFIGLPLALVTNDLLHALPNALAATFGLLLLVLTGIATVLIRTTATGNTIPEIARTDQAGQDPLTARNGAATGHLSVEVPTAVIPAVQFSSTESPTVAIMTAVIPRQHHSPAAHRQPLPIPVQRQRSPATRPEMLRQTKEARRWVPDGNPAG